MAVIFLLFSACRAFWTWTAWTGPQVLDLPCLGLQLCLGGVALVPAQDPQLRLAAGLAGMVLRGGAHQHAQPGH